MRNIVASINRYFNNQTIRVNTMTRKHPILSGIAFIVLFYIYDSYASSNVMEIDDWTYLLIIFTMLFIVYTTYMKTKLEDESLSPKLRKINNVAFISLSLVSVIAVLFYDVIFGTFLPSLYEGFNKAQILIWVLVAPVTEELVFRYLFYDRWALSKFKKPIAMILVAVFFVMLHPVTDLSSFVMFMLPTLLLFMTYDMAGIYASMLVHMIFNTLSLL